MGVAAAKGGRAYDSASVVRSSRQRDQGVPEQLGDLGTEWMDARGVHAMNN